MTTIPDQSPDFPATAQSMRLVALMAFLNVPAESITTHEDAPHLFSVSAVNSPWDYIVTERELNPRPPTLEHLGNQYGHWIYAVK